MPENDFEKLQKSMAMRDFRLQAGRDPDAVAWQEALERILIKMGDKLSPGRLETFPGLQGGERKMFSTLAKKVMVPDHVCAIYMPPSILESMLKTPPGEGAAAGGEGAIPEKRLDAGICLGTRSEDFDTVLYAQFALPPHTPGVEIYQDGEVVAVYQYPTIEDCVDEMSGLINTFFKRPAR